MSARTTVLDAVNQMLSCIGGAAVVTLDTDNPEVFTAQSILEETTRNVLAEGWNFNTELEYPFPIQTNGEIGVPDNLISFTLSFYKHGADRDLIVERGGKFYNKKDHTYTFTETIYADVVWYFPFVDCPQPMKEYITARASRIYASRLVTSEEQVQLIAQDESATRTICIEYDTATGKPNVFGLHDGTNNYISYQPYRSLLR